jgi:hypothetical protein
MDRVTRRKGGHTGTMPSFVMAGLSRPKDGVASLAYVPAIHAFRAAKT